MPQISHVFFDIGETLGSISLDPSGAPSRLDTFDYVPPVLEEIRAGGRAIGVISNTGDLPARRSILLEQAGLMRFLERRLLVYSSVVGVTKQSPAIFAAAAQAAGSPAEQCRYVGEDAWERKHAAEAGFAVCPHPLLASSCPTRRSAGR
jgi:bacterial leucyl aminopeptidase